MGISPTNKESDGSCLLLLHRSLASLHLHGVFRLIKTCGSRPLGQEDPFQARAVVLSVLDHWGRRIHSITLGGKGVFVFELFCSGNLECWYMLFDVLVTIEFLPDTVAEI